MSKTNSTLKRVFISLIAMVLALTCILEFAPSATVEASNFFPNVTSSSYLEMHAIQWAPVYTSKDLKTRGNCSRAYNTACIDAGDLIYIYYINSDADYCKVNYPAGSTRRTGYCRFTDIFTQYVSECYIVSPIFTSKKTTAVYSNPSLSGQKYGTSVKGDRVWDCGTYLYNSNVHLIIYDAKSGNRRYKAGWAVNIY